MGEILQPAICMTEKALQHAQSQGVYGMTFNRDGFEEVARIARRPLYEVNGLTIAFGGCRKLLGAIQYDQEQTYKIIHEQNGITYRFDDPELPVHTLGEPPNTTMIICPIPKKWTAANVATSLYKGVHKHPNVVKVAAAINAGGIATGAVIGGIGFSRVEGIDPGEAVALGASLGFLAAGGVTPFTGPVMDLLDGRRVTQAKQQRPFFVFNR